MLGIRSHHRAVGPHQDHAQCAVPLGRDLAAGRHLLRHRLRRLPRRRPALGLRVDEEQGVARRDMFELPGARVG